VNEQTLGIFYGIIFTIIVMVISISLTLFYIYNNNPNFVCDLCTCNNTFPYLIINP